MRRSTLAKSDQVGWRADVVERLDRRSIGAALAWVAFFSSTLIFISPSDASTIVLRTLFNFGSVMATLAILAVALVAVARGLSPWVAYPTAAVASFAIGSVLGLAIDPLHWYARTPTPPLQTMIVGHVYFLSFLCPYAVLYVYVSSATQNEKVLRALEHERATELERLARQRLQTELATIDHDLVLRSLRLAQTRADGAAAEAQALLETVTAYLRAAQQRDSSEPGRIAAALTELRHACAGRESEPPQHAIA